MIKVIPYSPEHLDIFEAQEADIERYGAIDSEMYHPVAEHGISFTAIADGRILVVGGILPTIESVGHCWTIVSKHAHEQRLSVLKIVKIQLENMMRDLKLHRVETANLVNAKEHHKWCKLLGFEEEGILKQYDKKKRDYIRFAKLMEV